MKKRCLIFHLLIFSGGCAYSPSKIENPLLHNFSNPKTAAAGTCAEFFVETEQAVASAGVLDTQSARIPGYPYLRVNRFLSSFRHEVKEDTFDAWTELLQQQAMEGWFVEISNLPAKERLKLERWIGDSIFFDRSLIEALDDCSGLLRENDLAAKSGRDALRDRAVVPYEYQTWKRIMGLYPISALVFRSGIDHWHEETLETYSLPLQDLPVMGEVVRYAPLPLTDIPSHHEAALILKKSYENPLRIPLPTGEDSHRLFDHYAPIFEIDIASQDDRLGSPVWQGKEYPQVDTSKPTVYQHLSHTRVGSFVLLQLNYTIWFPSRPLESSLDLLGGHLDGITWRVTLLPDGRPWLYDTIHNCGCYHLFFPGQYAEKLEQQSLYEEPAFTPQQGLQIKSGHRPVLRIASRTHFVERVYFDSDERDGRKIYYAFVPALALRSLPIPNDGRRSLYGQDGLIAGSERKERFLFWPMGIPSPGGMRQWGHHATAFVGRRHFDDARIFEKYFKIIESYEPFE